MFSFPSIRPWGLLIFALLLTTLAVKHGADVIVWIAILVCFAASIFDFFAIPLQRGQQKREERRRHRLNQLRRVTKDVSNWQATQNQMFKNQFSLSDNLK